MYIIDFRSDKEIGMLCTQYIQRLKRTCKHRVEQGYHKCYQHRKAKYPRPSECPICTFTFAKYIVPLNPCKHWVCPECIIRSGKKECPLCRSDIKIPNRHITSLKFYAGQMKKYISEINIELLPDDLQINLRTLVNDMFSEIDSSEISDFMVDS
jgi:Ring finger domain